MEPALNVLIAHERKNKMENKKTTIALVIVVLLIIALIAVSYFYNDFNTNQVATLTAEANKILESNIIEDNIDFKIKTEKNYAEVEAAIKEYISGLKNIYIEMQQMVSGINPNSIFTAQNMPDKNLAEINNIINEYKEKSQNLISEYEELVSEKMIKENINNFNINTRIDYYANLYNEIMLNETMQKQFLKLDEEIKNEKANLYDKLNKIGKMKSFLEEHKDSWIIKEDRINFTNVNRMTEYYSLFNQVID